MPNLGTAEVGITKPMVVAKSTRPRVMAVMLTKDRPEMAARAVRCFRTQTYENKRLFVLDTGRERFQVKQEDGVYAKYFQRGMPQTIGGLRNEANSYGSPACLGADIICHFDDDDLSHPRRIEEQVALLESSGKECVGYNEMLFWKLTGLGRCHDYQAETLSCADENALRWTCTAPCHEAWRYRLPLPGYALGTSLCYWRRAWARHPFPDKSNGEDWGFLKGVSCESASALIERVYGKVPAGDVLLSCEPRMIATLHGSNTATRLDPSKSEWTREPEWDARVREILEKA